MMHGRGKSDSAIVAKKSGNKAGMPAAERMERRVETEGNANRQSTCRAQNRASVYLALEPRSAFHVYFSSVRSVDTLLKLALNTEQTGRIYKCPELSDLRTLCVPAKHMSC